LAKIESLHPTELIILGISTATYPILLVAIHKSIIYGNMEFTGKLIGIAKKIASDSEASDETWLNFYEKIYNELHNVVRKSKSRKSYSQAIRALSDQIQCDSIINKYKCKILAILGDLEKYDEIRYEDVDRGLSLYHAIDSDLEYISQKFNFIDKLEAYKNALVNKDKMDFQSKNVMAFLSYFVSRALFRKTWDEYLEDLNRKIIEKRRIIPTLLLINRKDKK